MGFNSGFKGLNVQGIWCTADMMYCWYDVLLIWCTADNLSKEAKAIIIIIIYVILLLCLCILIICLCIFIVPAGTLRLPWLRVFRAFSSVVRQVPGYNPQRRGTAPHSSKIFVLFYILFAFLSFCVLFVCICVLYYCHRVATQLQLTNISYQ